MTPAPASSSRKLLLFRGDSPVPLASYDAPAGKVGSANVVKIGTLASATCSMVLEGEGVARMHAVIEGVGPDTWRLIDLGSEHGTKINGEPVDKIRDFGLADVIQIGGYTIRVGNVHRGAPFTGEFGDGRARCLTHPDQACEGEMPTCRAVADGGPAPADMRTPLIDPADLRGRLVTIAEAGGRHTFASSDRFVRFNVNERVQVRLTDIGRAHIRAQRIEQNRRLPESVQQPIEVAEVDGWSEWQLWEIMELLGPQCGQVRPLAFETDIVLRLPREPAADATELGRQFARGQRFDALELESPVETSLAVIYDNEDIAHEVGKIYVYDGAAVIHVVEPQAVKYLQGGGAVELSRDREFAGNPYKPFVDDRGNPVSVLAELEALSTWDGSEDRLENLVARLAKAVMYSHRVLVQRMEDGRRPSATPSTGPEPLDGVCLVMRMPLAGQDYPSIRVYFDGLFAAADAARMLAPADSRLVLVLPHEVHELATDTLQPTGDGREAPLLDLLRAAFPQLEIRCEPPPASRTPGGIPTWSSLRNENERLRAELRRLREAWPDGAARRGDVPGAFEELVRQAGGAGYLTHLDPGVLQMRPRDLLAEALKFGSEADRDLGVLRQGRPDSSRMRVEFGTDGYEIPIDIAGEYLRADVGSPERIAVLLAGVAEVSDRVLELEEAVESAASRIEVDSESDSIDDRFAAAAEAARLLRRAL